MPAAQVKKIVKVVGFVNCPDDYTQQPEVLNGCSNLFGEVRPLGSPSRRAWPPQHQPSDCAP